MSDPTHHSTPPRTTTASASTILANRVLIQAGCADALPLAASAAFATAGSRASGGLVLTGAQAASEATRVRREHPDVMVCIDTVPERSGNASADEPFHLGDADLFTEPSLDRSLDEQLLAGATVALTPTGHIPAGDSAALKATIEQANALDREDVIVRLPCDVAWATKPHDKQLAAVVSRSRHPVALSLAHPQDPLERAGAAETLWQLAATQPHVMLWRTDMAGLAHLCNGGLAAAVGFSPSLRHGVQPGRPGHVNNPQDKSPGILLPDWLRYMKGSRVEQIFAATAAPRCDCSVCRGRALDRFDDGREDKFTAHAHNVAVLQQMVGAVLSLNPAERTAWWGRAVALALQTHTDATALTRVHVAPTRALRSWSKHPAMVGS
jgi:hypothetical protein